MLHVTHDTAEPPDYPLDPALDFLQRLWRLSHALEVLSSRMDKELGVTAQQRLIIRCVGKFPGMPAGRLASLLHVDPATVSVSLKRLVAKGLIERRRDPRDKRRSALGLTAKGRALDQPAEHTVEGAVERLLAQAEPGAIDTTMRVLAALTTFLDAEAERPR